MTTPFTPNKQFRFLEIARKISAKANPPKKTASGVVAAKKAAKIIIDMGMSVEAIETIPTGGFRVVAAAPGANPANEPNEWDD